ncbi:MAG TPA: LysE family transporter [Flavobacteriaceae bacterium]|nr:LysE family transporter [Flavobacteriaceae bacterium]
MFQDVAAAIPIGFFLAFLLGPVFFVLLETAALKGFRAAFFLDLGVIFADIVFLMIAYFSTSRLLNIIKDDPALFIFGGGVLVTFGVISYINQRKVIPQPETAELRKSKKSDYLGLAIKGFLLNFVNIGVLGFWLGLIIVFGPTMEMNPQRLLVFFSSVLITYLAIDIAKILLAKKLNHKLTPIRIYRIKKWINILIIVFGAILIVRGIFPSKLEKIDDKFEIFPET